MGVSTPVVCARRLALAVAVAVATVVFGLPAPPSAHAAPPVAAPTRHPANPESHLVTETSQVLPAWTPAVNLVNAYGQAVRDRPRPDQWGLTRRATTYLAVAFGIADWVQVDVGLPMLLYQEGATGNTTAESALNAAAIGDLRTGLKGTFVRSRNRGFGLGASFDLTSPTGARDDLFGEAGFTYAPQLLTEYRGVRGIETALNVGYLARPDSGLGDYLLGDEITYRAALRIPFGPQLALSVTGELDGRIGVVDGAQSPLSALGGLRWRMRSGVVLGLHGGGAVVRGFGVPDVQGLLVLGFAPPARIGRERAFAGSETPSAAELALRHERVVALHRAPEPARVASLEDPDGDGILGVADACPWVAEDLDGFEDEDGCPDLDNDGDGLRDAVDLCPDEPEVINGWADWDGCPDRRLADGGGETRPRFDPALHLPRIEFAPGEAELGPDGVAAVLGLAELVRLNPWIGALEIGVGLEVEADRPAHLALAEARARTLRDALEAAGVDPWRIEVGAVSAVTPGAPERVELAVHRGPALERGRAPEPQEAPDGQPGADEPRLAGAEGPARAPAAPLQRPSSAPADGPRVLAQGPEETPREAEGVEAEGPGDEEGSTGEGLPPIEELPGPPEPPDILGAPGGSEQP